MILLVVSVAALVVAIGLSLAIGTRPVPPHVVLDVILGRPVDPQDYHAVAVLRFPRTVVGLLAGIGLGVAGAVMQALTRNPLADPGLLGVTAGASFFVAIAVSALGVGSPAAYTWFALTGALVAAVAVALIGGSRGKGIDPIRLTLAGVALTAVLTGTVSAIRAAAPRTFNAMLTWEIGSLVNRGWDVIIPIGPVILVGTLLAFFISGRLNTMAMGDDLATTLGTSVAGTRVLAVLAVAALAGGATAIAGPISFVGLMVPHIVRRFSGGDQRWIIGISVLLSPVLLLLSDVLGRLVLWPGEMAVGVVTAFLGAPLLIAIIRQKKVIAL